MRLPSVSSPIAPGPRLRIFAAVTIVSAAVISFDSIRHLADYAGFGELSWLFPLTLDAVAAFGMDLWVRRSPAWKQARALALVSILGSTVANIADHWISSGTILPAVLGAVPPAMLAALLAVLHRHGAGVAGQDRTGPDTAVRDLVWRSLPQADRYRNGGPSEAVRTFQAGLVPMPPVPTDDAVQVATPVRRVPSKPRTASAPRQVRSGGPADDVIVKAIRSAHDADPKGRWLSKREVMAEHSVGSGRALKLINLAKAPEEIDG